MFKKTVRRDRSERGGEAYVTSYVEPLRFTPCRIRPGTSVNAAEMVRRQCPARTPLAGFFIILLGTLEFLEYLPTLQQFHRFLQLDILLKREFASRFSR